MNKLSHVAFIMDGNGRWGLRKKKGRNFGHKTGVKTVSKIVEGSIKLKIPILTFYVFSTENWKRPKKEINFLFNLIVLYFKKELDNVVKNGIKIQYDTAVIELIYKKKIVCGVKILHKKKIKKIFSKSVVLACGGSESSSKMRKKHLGVGWDTIQVMD